MVCHEELDEGVMDTSISIGYIQPCHRQGSLELFCHLDDTRKLGMVFNHPKDRWEERLLNIFI